MPLALLVLDGLRDNLTVNPIQTITFRTGKFALVLLALVAGLHSAQLAVWRQNGAEVAAAAGPLRVHVRRLHFLTFAVLDYGLDPVLLREAIFEKRYALSGSPPLLLVPLAITSTRGWMKRLGKHWKRLHQLVYIAAAGDRSLRVVGQV